MLAHKEVDHLGSVLSGLRVPAVQLGSFWFAVCTVHCRGRHVATPERPKRSLTCELKACFLMLNVPAVSFRSLFRTKMCHFWFNTTDTNFDVFPCGRDVEIHGLAYLAFYFSSSKNSWLSMSHNHAAPGKRQMTSVNCRIFYRLCYQTIIQNNTRSSTLKHLVQLNHISEVFMSVWFFWQTDSDHCFGWHLFRTWNKARNLVAQKWLNIFCSCTFYIESTMK